MQIVSEQRDRHAKRGKEELFGHERPVEGPWGETCASKKKNTHGFIHVKGSSGASLFTNIDSALKSSQTMQYLYIEAPY